MASSRSLLHAELTPEYPPEQLPPRCLEEEHEDEDEETHAMPGVRRWPGSTGHVAPEILEKATWAASREVRCEAGHLVNHCQSLQSGVLAGPVPVCVGVSPLPCARAIPWSPLPTAVGPGAPPL